VTVGRHDAAALSGARPVSFRLDSAERPHPAPALDGEATADLLVIGGGRRGPWTAPKAEELWLRVLDRFGVGFDS
jgi:hypothetical protein